MLGEVDGVWYFGIGGDIFFYCCFGVFEGGRFGKWKLVIVSEYV